MNETTADAFVNREEPVSLLAIPGSDGTSSDPESKRDKLRNALSGSKLKEKLQDGISGKSISGHSLQDRLFAKLLQQVIPSEDMGEVLEMPDKQSSNYVNRPSFSLPLMTNNFRRFNARIGVVFVFENRLIRLLSWRKASHTLSLLAVCTFVCLNPYLLAVLPLAGALLSIMVPAFLARHPPPPPAISQAPFYSINGPPLAPARTIKPAAEMSKDFFRNMRDLQNSMDDFSVLHDTVLKTVTPPTNFSNESRSSTLFQFLFIASCTLFISSHLLPWRIISLMVCWTIIPLGHPKVQTFVWSNREEHLRPHERTAQSWLDSWIAQDIILDAAAETREVEIFELQRRKGGRSGEWESWMFSPSPYDPLSPQRISGGSPKGARFFEDVQPPNGWEWDDKKWVLDLASKDWVEERMVQGVEVEIEGERWVGDLLAEGLEEDIVGGKSLSPGKDKRRDWEEWNGSSMMGEWRRRRWIRMVRRKILEGVDRNLIKSSRQ